MNDLLETLRKKVAEIDTLHSRIDKLEKRLIELELENDRRDMYEMERRERDE